MQRYHRLAHGVEAGAIAAGTVELSFFVLDLVRLEPLATPAILSGASLGPGGGALDLGSLSGVLAGLWGTYQILTLTFTHVLTFALAGLVASLLFDWSRPGGIGRILFVTLLCTAAFFGTVAVSSSVVALDTVGTAWVMGINLLGALALVGSLRFVSSDSEALRTPE